MGRRTAISAVATAAALLLAALPAPTAQAGTPAPPPLGLRDRQTEIVADTNTIIVTFDRAQSNPGQAATTAVEQPADQVADADISKVVPITSKLVAVTLDQPVTEAEAAAIGDQVEQSDGVKAAEPSEVLTAGTTDDGFYTYLWNLKANSPSSYGVDAETAWTTSTGAGTVVGVIDTGITAHPDLTGSSSAIVGGNVIAGYDFISDSASAGDGDGRDADPSDAGDFCASDPNASSSSWHGTHVAGIIAAIGNNGRGVVGVAPDAKIQPLRALGRCGGTIEDIITAILWGSGVSVIGLPQNPHPASVLNLSLGGRASCTVAMQTAINAAVAKGVPVVVAAGNDNEALANEMPANCSNVIRVVASSYEGARAPYSNYGSSAAPATIAAPGGSGNDGADVNDWILSTWNFGTESAGMPAYAGMVGTSMAAPHVAAVAALLKQLDPSMSAAKITDYLTGSATAMPSCGTTACGAGVVNAARAVAAADATAVLAKLAKPSIAGTPVVGATLSTSGAGATGATYSYQWLRNGSEQIAGATASSYVVSTDDLGAQLSVTVTATIAGSSASKTSEPVSITASSVADLAVPVITGTPAVGRRLTTAGTGVDGALYSYQWYRSGTAVSGATASGYLVTGPDLGKQLSVRVTATLRGESVSKTSASTQAVVAGRFANTARPSTSGTHRKGHTLKVKAGNWAPSATTVKYRWLRNGASISGATKSSYKLTSKDKGKRISVRVTVYRSGYLTTSVTSSSRRIS